MLCPFCPENAGYVVKFGFLATSRLSKKRVQRYLCKTCHRHFSDQTFQITYRQHKPYLDQPMFRLLCSGVSQRRTAFIFGTTKKTVARKMMRLGGFAKQQLSRETQREPKASRIVFDELETFEHSKCKPLSVPLAVEEGSRRILAVECAKMPAKGHLAEISRKRYGFRPDHRGTALRKLMADVKLAASVTASFKSDECPRYPKVVAKFFPTAKHQTFKGRRGCVVGQGELKRGGFDPLFSLNHTCAMLRDNLKRLSRRTWCTTKNPEALSALLYLYSCYHNDILTNRKLPPELRVDSSTAKGTS